MIFLPADSAVTYKESFLRFHRGPPLRTFHPSTFGQAVPPAFGHHAPSEIFSMSVEVCTPASNPQEARNAFSLLGSQVEKLPQGFLQYSNIPIRRLLHGFESVRPKKLNDARKTYAGQSASRRLQTRLPIESLPFVEPKATCLKV